MKTLDVIIWLILFFFAATMVSDLGCSQHKIDELHLVRDWTFFMLQVLVQMI
jgi:hypothetical protein